MYRPPQLFGPQSDGVFSELMRQAREEMEQGAAPPSTPGSRSVPPMSASFEAFLVIRSFGLVGLVIFQDLQL